MDPIISVTALDKTYRSGQRALKGVSLQIRSGEILALLGPNGAGKTTLISMICGLTSPSSGQITVGGYDIVTDYRAARSLIGLQGSDAQRDAHERGSAALRPPQQRPRVLVDREVGRRRH